MEIVETASNKTPDVNGQQGAAVDNKEDRNPQYAPLSDVKSTDTDSAFNNSPELKIASLSMSENSDVVDLAKRAEFVTITDEDKNRFIDSVVSGTRFTSYADIYGGRVRIKFRSRTLAETEAVMSYVHREGIAGKIVTKADLSDTIMSALFVAQVAEVGDVAYPEMKPPYKYEETAAGISKPGWLGEVEMWKSKPEHLTAAVGNALVDFEAKYWKMIAESKNENFWKPGGSTGA